jgi:hypothetical protein
VLFNPTAVTGQYGRHTGGVGINRKDDLKTFAGADAQTDAPGPAAEADAVWREDTRDGQRYFAAGMIF